MNPQTKLCVAYVTLLLPARFGNSPLLGMDYEKELALKLFAKLHEEYFKGLNQRVQFEHKWGTGPAKVIFRAAIDCSCELIVIGSRTKGRFRAGISGSVSYGVVKLSKVSVPVIRDQPSEKSLPNRRVIPLQ